MSKTFIALLSFVCGVLFMTCFGFLNTSMKAEIAQNDNESQYQSGIDLGDATPTVPPLLLGISGVTFGHTFQKLDGLDCKDCTFADGSSLLYGGGSFSLDNLRIVGKTGIRFTGAAANTIRLLTYLKAIKVGNENPPQPAEPTIDETTIAKRPLKIRRFTTKPGTFIGPGN